MKKNQFYWHMYLRQSLPNGTEKHFYFRCTEDEKLYECEEYLLTEDGVSEPEFGRVDKAYHDEVLANEYTTASYPTVYFDKKGEWTAFGESLIG